MKKVIALLGCLLISIVSVYSIDVGISWDLNPLHENVDRYIIYKATSINGSFSPCGTVMGNRNTGIVSGLSPGYYKFYVVAHNIYGTSLPSKEIILSVALSPLNNRVVILELKQ
jgi:hypothetical protein